MNELIGDYAAWLGSPRARPKRRAASTIDLYTDVLRRLDRDLPYGLNRACEEELDAWIFGRGLSPGTQKLYRAVLRGYFRFCFDPRRPRLKGINPAELLDPVSVEKGRPRPIPPEQYADILNRAAEPYRTWFLLASLTGARCCELADLDRADITRDSVLLHGKGGKDRRVPTHPDVWQVARALPPGPVLRTAAGGRMDRKQVSDRGRWHMQHTLGHRDVSMHRWRHTALTEVYDECHDLLVARDFAGHASVATTEIYVAPRESAMRRAVAGLRRAA